MQNNIRAIREEKQMTQVELSKAANVSRTVICQLESGKRPVITTDTMLKISKALDRPIEDIFFTSGV